MMRARKALGLLVIVPCVIWTGCSREQSIRVAGEQGKSAQAERAVQELAIRHLVAREASDGPIFLSFGSSREDGVDPPAEFLERLADTGVTFRPVSMYREREEANPVLLVVRVAGWNGEDEARVSATRFRLGAGGAEGFTATARWARGFWTMTEPVLIWST